MHNDDFFMKIKQMMPQLPEGERRVAEFVVRHADEAVGYSINQLADASSVSITTISRFCLRLGLDGYRTFRIALAKEWGFTEKLTYVDLEPSDNLTILSQKIFEASIQTLKDTQKTLDLNVLEQVVEAMIKARRVDLYATGGAGIVAREFHFKIMQLGVNANAFLDLQMQMMSAAVLNSNDLALGISHSGQDRHIVRLLQLASNNGATTAALTSYPGSPMAKAADFLLCTPSLASDYTFDSPTVRNAQLAIVDIIYENMLMKSSDITRKKMGYVAEAISELKKEKDSEA